MAYVLTFGMNPRRFICTCSVQVKVGKTNGKGLGDTHIREDAVCEIVLLGVHALLDDRIPYFDILGVPWGPLERGDGKVHLSPLAELDEPPREFIRLQKWAPRRR